MTTTEVLQHGASGHEAHEHEGPSYDDINTPVIVLVGAISAILTLLSIMFVQGMYYHWQNSYLQEATTEVVSMPANDQIATQKAVLNGGNGVVSIGDAMQAVVKKYGK